MDEDAFRAGASGRPHQEGFDRNDYHRGMIHRRNMDAISGLNEGRTWTSSSGGGGPSGTITLKGCLAGVAFLIGVPTVAYVVIGIGIAVYEHREKQDAGQRQALQRQAQSAAGTQRATKKDSTKLSERSKRSARPAASGQ